MAVQVVLVAGVVEVVVVVIGGSSSGCLTSFFGAESCSSKFLGDLYPLGGFQVLAH